jgi:hypothetical protein
LAGRGHLLTFIPEMKTSGRDSTAHRNRDRLKSFCTDAKQICELKGQEAFQTTNPTRTFITTNHAYVVHLETQQRRYFLCSVSDAWVSNSELWSAVHAEMKMGDCLLAISNVLSRIELKSFNPNRIPKTEKNLEQTVGSQHAAFHFCAWITKSIPDECTHFEVHGDRYILADKSLFVETATAFRWFSAWHQEFKPGARKPSQVVFRDHLRRYGYQSVKKRKNDTRYYYYCFESIGTLAAYLGTTTEELSEHLL